jgi:hypothetical protein
LVVLTVALAAVIVGLIAEPALLMLGALLLVAAPLAFLFAAPPPRKGNRDYVAEAYSRLFGPRSSHNRD